ncbi:hypothetical protein QUB60_23005 [Microcoleus sp. A2-C5]
MANHETVADTLVDIGIYDNIESILEHLNQCKKHFLTVRARKRSRVFY